MFGLCPSDPRSTGQLEQVCYLKFVSYLPVVGGMDNPSTKASFSHFGSSPRDNLEMFTHNNTVQCPLR